MRVAKSKELRLARTASSCPLTTTAALAASRSLARASRHVSPFVAYKRGQLGEDASGRCVGSAWREAERMAASMGVISFAATVPHSHSAIRLPSSVRPDELILGSFSQYRSPSRLCARTEHLSEHRARFALRRAAEGRRAGELEPAGDRPRPSTAERSEIENSHMRYVRGRRSNCGRTCHHSSKMQTGISDGRLADHL